MSPSHLGLVLLYTDQEWLLHLEKKKRYANWIYNSFGDIETNAIMLLK